MAHHQQEVHEMINGKVTLVSKYIPPPSPNWVRRNFTLGNVLTILSMLGATVVFTMTWARASELNDVRLADHVSVITTRLNRVEAETMTRETVNAKLDGIMQQLVVISQRIDQIERRR